VLCRRKARKNDQILSVSALYLRLGVEGRVEWDFLGFQVVEGVTLYLLYLLYSE